MGSWEYSNICIGFKNAKNKETLIDQTMKCLGYYEADFLNLEDDGLYGPRFKYKSVNTELIYKSGLLSDNELVALLNLLFDSVSVYTVQSSGSNTSDYYSGNEMTYDARDKTITTVEIDYCYGDGTAFGVEVDYEDFDKLRKAGTRVEKRTVDIDEMISNINKEHLSQIIEESTKQGYSELIELVRKAEEKLK